MNGRAGVFREFFGKEGGAAAMELALCLGLLILPTLNVIDLAVYAYCQMQTHNAAEMAVEAAFSDCAEAQYLPATNQLPNGPKCTASSSIYKIAATDVVSAAINETTLANSVSLSSLVEGFYCATTLNTIVAVASTAQTCSGAANAADSSATPGDYVVVTATYHYTPMFKGITVSSLLPTTITRTAYMRLG
ncbi:MAG TPA: TadE/TadG family type IV pilus assembly protein [Caulobacteraceae bacterium]|nr:TadE/TadG family type IV pilus assembly protein [Caulobacteraceae bacterium]